MNPFLTTFEAVAALLGIGIIGFYIVRRRMLPEKVLGLLSPLALDIALPSLVFANIVTGFSPASQPQWWQLPLWWLGFTALAFVFTLALLPLTEQSIRREFAVTLFYNNAIFFPLAIVTGLFGGQSPLLVSIFLFTIFYPAFFFSTWPFFFGERRGIAWRKVVHPVLIATVAAVVIRLAGWHVYVPSFVVSMLELLGGMTVPLLLIILGGSIYIDFTGARSFNMPQVTLFVVAKNLLLPLLFLAVIYIVRPPADIGFLLLLEAAVPPVTAIPAVTQRAGGDRAAVAQFVVGSFVASLLTIPAMVYLYSLFFPLPA
ncbi:MAG: AEC family transporter [Candidatus Thermoplasmatota archaeon]|nr:AEC family transporter [Candidatus Thermoplasmatota archaeon]